MFASEAVRGVILACALACGGCWIDQATSRAAAPAPRVVPPLPAPREVGHDGAAVPTDVARYRPTKREGWRAHLEELLPREFSPRRIAERAAHPTVAALCSDLQINPEAKRLSAQQTAALDALIVDAGASLRAAVLAHSRCHRDALLRASDAGRVALTRSLIESRAFEAELTSAYGPRGEGWISSQVLLPDDRAPGVLHLYVTRMDEPQLFRLAHAMVVQRAALRERLRTFFAAQ